MKALLSDVGVRFRKTHEIGALMALLAQSGHGLPDQFGGTDGKKMKIARLKRLIEHVSKLPMDEQKEAIAKFYFEWKGTFEQVDDILIMGIKV